MRRYFSVRSAHIALLCSTLRTQNALPANFLDRPWGWLREKNTTRERPSPYLTKGIMMKLSLVLALFFAIFPLSVCAQLKLPSPKTYRIECAIDPTWGKLISVFDQANSQRLTFDNETQMTIVQVGLVWDSFAKAFEPNITQIIVLKKTAVQPPLKVEL